MGEERRSGVEGEKERMGGKLCVERGGTEVRNESTSARVERRMNGRESEDG